VYLRTRTKCEAKDQAAQEGTQAGEHCGQVREKTHAQLRPLLAELAGAILLSNIKPESEPV